ncbi:MAG TPA: methyltransferase domain-containing protein [Solirubrobacteraceae bacterium]|nr:methyltransferase domain-containing protein [Solirubrobacteraceae bacterium]
MSTEHDRWSRWLLERRDGGNERRRAASLSRLAEIRDRVLDAAEPLAGATLLDVGAGDGLIALAALERVGPAGDVIFSDVSAPLLDRCRELVAAQGDLARSRFVAAAADDLVGIPDASVDVVTTRSVLIYVVDKAKAFEAFARVLRPGGRVSLFEPINRLMYPEPEGRFWGYRVSAVSDLAAKVRTRFAGEDSAYREAMMGFDDRDLARFAEAAGFETVHVECHLDISPGSEAHPVDLDAFLDIAPNPNAPTVREAIAEALTGPERRRFLEDLGRAVAENDAIRRMAVAYLLATKPDLPKLD